MHASYFSNLSEALPIKRDTEEGATKKNNIVSLFYLGGLTERQKELVTFQFPDKLINR